MPLTQYSDRLAAGGVRAGLAGRHLLLTGATGFVGEALLARILRDVPELRVSILVRGRSGSSAAERGAHLLAKRAFTRGGGARTPSGPAGAGARAGAGAGALAGDRVTVLDGDLATLPALPADLDLVVHCAGVVSFDPPVDEGFETNVHGTVRLLEAIAATGARPHYLHVSTAYVAGLRRGVIPEASLEHDVDWRAEARAAARVRDAAEDSSRSPGVLAALRRRAEREHAAAGPLAVAADIERRRRTWVHDRLVAAGGERARSLGWTDCYTFTKAMGERAVEELTADLPVSVVRPAIIESALERPYPGWIEGFKMAEPIILAFGRGELPEFPGSPDAVCDIVPVDHVVNALLTVAATSPPPGQPAYFHVSSGARNPLTFRRLHTEVNEYFTSHPIEQPGLGASRLPQWTWPGAPAVERVLAVAERAHGAADTVVGVLPRGQRVRAAAAALDRQGRRLEFLRRYHDLYRPYVQAELEFSLDRALALQAQLSGAERTDFGFDPAVIDWTHYLRDVHCPSVSSTLRALGRRARGTGPAAPPAPQQAAEPVLAAFDMDGTLLRGNVVESYLRLRLPGSGPLGSARAVADVAARLPGWLLADARDRGAFLRSMYRRYQGADVADLERWVDDHPELVLDRLAPAALRRVRAHRAAGHRTVLLTGAVAPLTRPLAPLFDVIVAAELEVDRTGRATGFLRHPPLVGEARAAWLRHQAASHGAALADCHAYADSHSDLPLLESVGHPVVVDPDVPLARAARRARWPVVNWHGAS